MLQIDGYEYVLRAFMPKPIYIWNNSNVHFLLRVKSYLNPGIEKLKNYSLSHAVHAVSGLGRVFK